MQKNIPLVVGNWKQNPRTQTEAEQLLKATAKAVKKITTVTTAVAPPFVYLATAKKLLAKSTVGIAAQTVSEYDGGAYTGDISAQQLADLSVSYVIIGHSERRAAGLTEASVQAQIQKAFAYRLTPIVCVGEKSRDEHGDFFTFVEQQLRSLTSGLTPAQLKQVVIAYEPIWAIGTGKTATAADVKEMQLFIVSVLTKLYSRPTAESVRLLYGGSVKPNNAAELHRTGDMQGFLVGGASLQAEDFAAICAAIT